MMGDLVGDHVGAREGPEIDADRVAEGVEEPRIEVDAVVRRTVEGADAGALRAAGAVDLVAEDRQSRRGVLDAGRRELPHPHRLGVVEHLGQERALAAGGLRAGETCRLGRLGHLRKALDLVALDARSGRARRRGFRGRGGGRGRRARGRAPGRPAPGGGKRPARQHDDRQARRHGHTSNRRTRAGDAGSPAAGERDSPARGGGSRRTASREEP